MQSSRVISETVGRQVEEFRRARGMTQKQFVEACAAIGWKITPATIENIEGAVRIRDGKPGLRREISVDELLALALVLGVHPIDLLVPGDAADSDLVPIPPDLEVPAAEAREWITGAGFGFLPEPQDLAELAEVIRRVPRIRGAALNKAWWTPERIREQQRQASAALRAEQEAQAMAPEGNEAPGTK